MIRTFLSHGCNAVLLALLASWSAAATACLPIRPALFLLGATTFLVSEYGFHRFVLHARPARSPLINRLQRRLHYDHHAQPDRLDLLFLPSWFLVPSLASSAGLAWWIWPEAGSVASLLAGIVAALLTYEWMHYVAHVPYRPRTPWGRWIKKTHLWHHFKNENYWFGVTHPGLDLVLGTYGKPGSVSRSATARALDRT